MYYAELQCQSNFSFLYSASTPAELVERAAELDYQAIAITDICSLAGIVKAHVRAAELGIKLIVGSQLKLQNGCEIIVLCPNKTAYAELSGLITLARRRSPKGEYRLHMEDLRFRLKHCFLIWLADCYQDQYKVWGKSLQQAFLNRLWIGVHHSYQSGEQLHFAKVIALSKQLEIPMVACGNVRMHCSKRKYLLDTLTAIRLNTSVYHLGRRREQNRERYLKPISAVHTLYPELLIRESCRIADRCNFSLDELRYQYPKELVPHDITPIAYLRKLTVQGAAKRWPQAVPEKVGKLIEYELQLIEEMHYEYYFLTVEDIVRFARSQNILCQGRGSAANSVVCYCLHITEISPELINMLFERFISKERDEPPDIDVDFEHQRREEVIQYIYQKYGRERAALAATVITYRVRSAIRDVGRALGLDTQLIDALSKSLAWWDRSGDLAKRIDEIGMRVETNTMKQFYSLVQQIRGFPRHLSQHVGGFIITAGQVSELVPVENASMPERTVIQWDKEDIESLGLLKVDVLGLGMLSAIKKMLEMLSGYQPSIKALSDIPNEDPETYDMLCQGDSVGVFQIESRAQMSMLPRLKPRTFYDLVIEIAIVRPGPIQGDMVHPYLRRRDGKEAVSYPSDEIRNVLEPTLGIPIFQEQAIKLAMVAAGFSGGEADQLRRAMASWGKNGNLMKFEKKLINGMIARGYTLDFARRLFEQIKGFGGYGFPESHSASFALLCYASSWIKCHHPAVFYCALLNSQPMGFYSPSQLVQDARRHQVKVVPIDVQRSDWLSTIEMPKESQYIPILRLGFSQIKGFSEAVALRIEKHRPTTGFKSLHQLAQCCQLQKTDLEKLASADALNAVSGHRYHAHWQASGIEPSRPLFTNEADNSNAGSIKIKAPALSQEVTLDYQHTGLSLRPHPMSMLRHKYPFNRCRVYANLKTLGSGRFIRIAGLVTGRQRPGTANGTLFLTLEDETGNTSVIVWKRTQAYFRKPLLTAKLLMIKGTVETDNNVTHVVAGELIDMSHELTDLGIKSRDFH